MAATRAYGWGGDGNACSLAGLNHRETFGDDGIVQVQGEGLGHGQ